MPLLTNAYHYHWCNPGANNWCGAAERLARWTEFCRQNCVDVTPEFQKKGEGRKHSVNNSFQLFGSYTAVPIGPGVRNLNPARGLRPAFITLFTQLGALFFRFDARTRLAPGKVTNKIPVDFLESCGANCAHCGEGSLRVRV